MLQFGTEDRNVCMEEKTLRMTMKMQGSSWSWSEEFRPYLLMKDQSRLYFDQANIQEHQKVNQRLRAVSAAMEHMEAELTEWDEEVIHQLLEKVTVLAREKIRVTFRDGREIEQYVAQPKRRKLA